MISTSMRANAANVLEQGRQRAVTPHAAARQIAHARVREAMRVRGRLPA
jgi:glutamate dehydrogenase (NAD(P)+)